MDTYTYERFIRNNPDATLLAERKLHDVLHDEAIMRIYSYYWQGNYSYIFRYMDYMVTNPITLKVPIPYEYLPLFCYEWFQNYEEISGVNEMAKKNEEFYWAPNHMNIWKFAQKWEIRFGSPWGYNQGEKLREFKKTQVYSNLEDLKKNSSKLELLELKSKIGEMIDAL